MERRWRGVGGVVGVLVGGVRGVGYGVSREVGGGGGWEEREGWTATNDSPAQLLHCTIPHCPGEVDNFTLIPVVCVCVPRIREKDRVR